MNSKLKTAREDAGYSIKEVAEKLNIRKQYLIDLEEGNFDNIPGQIYVDGYTKMYYKFLGIDKSKKIVGSCAKRANCLTNSKEITNKYQIYIVIFCIFMLILTMFTYNFLKKSHHSNSLIDIEEIISDGNNQELFN